MGLCCTTLRFDLQETIGGEEGKNSTVYRAFDSQLNAELIIKKISKASIIEQYQSIDESNFFMESRILYDSKHPNVMQIQYASEDENFIYLSMPICRNGSINSLINQKHLTVREIVKYSLEFLSGLHYVHTKQLVHFDVKPTNILIDNNNKAVLTDFGLAKYTDIYGIMRPNQIYTPHKPPEAFKYADFTNKADIYQAGVTLYRMCNGNRIYNDKLNTLWSKGQLNEAIIDGKFPDRKFYLPHIPTQLRKIINKAMNIDIDKRYDTILDMLNDISSIDKNLDWEYNEDTNKHSLTCSIYNESKTHLNVLELIKNGENDNKILGKKIRISDNNTQQIKKWNIPNIADSKAFKQIETFIKEY